MRSAKVGRRLCCVGARTCRFARAGSVQLRNRSGQTFPSPLTHVSFVAITQNCLRGGRADAPAVAERVRVARHRGTTARRQEERTRTGAQALQRKRVHCALWWRTSKQGKQRALLGCAHSLSSKQDDAMSLRCPTHSTPQSVTSVSARQPASTTVRGKFRRWLGLATLVGGSCGVSG